MSIIMIPQKPESKGPVVSGRSCACGCTEFKEASRIRQANGPDSVMYECVACGDYRL